jgi:hypothetical protein
MTCGLCLHHPGKDLGFAQGFASGEARIPNQSPDDVVASRPSFLGAHNALKIIFGPKIRKNLTDVNSNNNNNININNNNINNNNNNNIITHFLRKSPPINI